MLNTFFYLLFDNVFSFIPGQTPVGTVYFSAFGMLAILSTFE